MDYARVHAALNDIRDKAARQTPDSVEEWVGLSEILIGGLPEVVETIRARYGHVVSALRAHQTQAARVRNLTDNVVRTEHVLGKVRAERRAYLAEHPDRADAELTKAAPSTMAVVQATDAHEDALATLETAQATFASTARGIAENTGTLLDALRELVPDPEPEPLTIYTFSRPDATHGDIDMVFVAAETMTAARRLAEENTSESWDSGRASISILGSAHPEFPEPRVLHVSHVGE